MQISKVIGHRLFLIEKEQYKEEKHKDLELIQYKGNIMKAKVAFVGTDCKYHKVGDIVIYQEPAGMDLSFEGVKYLVIPEPDIMFVL
jgi:co-chaperonin GroES (HSP10)